MILPIMTPVASSNIYAVGYENGDLWISFNNGTAYRYFGVPYAVYSSLMSAPSHGRFLNSFIRNVYPCQRIR
jgi:hypothetical protein